MTQTATKHIEKLIRIYGDDRSAMKRLMAQFENGNEGWSDQDSREIADALRRHWLKSFDTAA